MAIKLGAIVLVLSACAVLSARAAGFNLHELDSERQYSPVETLRLLMKAPLDGKAKMLAELRILTPDLCHKPSFTVGNLQLEPAYQQPSVLGYIADCERRRQTYCKSIEGPELEAQKQIYAQLEGEKELKPARTLGLLEQIIGNPRAVMLVRLADYSDCSRPQMFDWLAKRHLRLAIISSSVLNYIRYQRALYDAHCQDEAPAASAPLSEAELLEQELRLGEEQWLEKSEQTGAEAKSRALERESQLGQGKYLDEDYSDSDTESYTDSDSELKDTASSSKYKLNEKEPYAKFESKPLRTGLGKKCRDMLGCCFRCGAGKDQQPKQGKKAEKKPRKELRDEDYWENWA